MSLIILNFLHGKPISNRLDCIHAKTGRDGVKTIAPITGLVQRSPVELFGSTRTIDGSAFQFQIILQRGLCVKNLFWVLAFFLAINTSFQVAAQESDQWTQFRGKGGNGVSNATGLPTTWDSEKNVAWKCELPGFGASSPVMLGDLIYVTCYTGYGLDAKEPGDMSDLVRHLICVNAKSGMILWDKEQKSTSEEETYRQFLPLHGYASSTPAVDNSGVYLFNGTSGAAAYSLEGDLLWETPCGTKHHMFGTANSPVIYNDVVIINASVESGKLIGLDKKTGKVVWENEGIDQAWNTPCLVEVPDGTTELVVSIKGKILAFDPTSGKELWTCKGMDDYICPSPISKDGIAYALGSRKNTAIAVKAGGRGDVSGSHKLWELGKGSNVSSPVLHDGHLYFASDSKGIAYCVNAADGKLVYQERLEPKPDIIYASPLYADGKLYYVSREQGTYVIAATPEFKLIANNVMQDDSSFFNGSPIVFGKQIILRSNKALYCLGEQ
jgi:outer membrane protein assembly factor BamB